MPRLVCAALLVVVGCEPPPPQNVGAATPVLYEDDPMKADKKKYPRTTLESAYRISQRDECGVHCAYIREGEGRLQLDLRDDGLATVADEGGLREVFKAHKTRTEQVIAWKRGWRGKWEGRDGNVTLELAPEVLDCRRTDQSGQNDSPCEPLTLTLECTAVEVALQGKPPSSELSWMCEPTEAAEDEGLTPFPWVFGMHRRILAKDGGSSQEPRRRYQLEHPAPDERSAKQ